MPSLRGPAREQGSPLEGRHPAFPRAVRRAGLLLPKGKRLPAWGKPECLPSKARPVSKAALWREGILPSLAPSGALACSCLKENAYRRWGRQNAFPPRPGPRARRPFGGKASCLPSRRQARGPALAKRRTPIGVREGRMPSLQGPITLRSKVGPLLSRCVGGLGLVVVLAGYSALDHLAHFLCGEAEFGEDFLGVLADVGG